MFVNRHQKAAAECGGFHLYKQYFLIQLKSAMQYKTSFFLTCIGQFLVSFNVFIGIYFMFQRFHTVKGYSYNEVLLCFGITLMEFGLAEAFARGFDSFASIIGNGVFDRIMVRPRSLILQVLGQRIEFTRIGRMLQAVIMFAYGLAAGRVDWSLSKVLVVLFMLAGRHRSLFRYFSDLCGNLFFYTGRAGIHEYPHGRGPGIWQISCGYLRKKGAAVRYHSRSLRLHPVLSPSFSPGSGQMVVWTAAGRRLPLSASLLCAVADRGETL